LTGSKSDSAKSLEVVDHSRQRTQQNYYAAAIASHAAGANIIFGSRTWHGNALAQAGERFTIDDVSGPCH
jgi:hypothetical protein